MSIISQLDEYLNPLWAKLVLFALVLLLTSLVRILVLSVGERILGRKLKVWPSGLSLHKHFFPAFWLFLIFASLWGSLPFFKLSPAQFINAELAIHLASIVTGTWFISRVVTLFCIILYDSLDISGADNLYGRTRRTQVQFLEKFFLLAVWIAGFSMSLFLFDGARKLGTSLIASAGLAGIAIGFAAQKSLGNLLAGLQIAFTQPIRIDDVVVVEKEWGRIEEITLTYVVVCLWDLRRLVLPITYFTEKPFENWTRMSSQVIGSVFIYADYGVSVEKVRNEFHSILKKTPLWDTQVAALQVTNTTEQTIEMRAIMTASSSSRAFDLRCFVREALVDYLQKEQNQALPKTRVVIREHAEV